MGMHTETALRIPAWLIAVLAVAGVALGLLQAGVFEGPVAQDLGVSDAAAEGHASIQRRRPVGVAMAAGDNTSLAVAIGPATDDPATHFEQATSDFDAETQAESAALLDALVTEQANDP
jgi:hypothetical protein